MMRVNYSTPYGFPEKIELDDVVNRELISLMTQSPINPEDFYLTGYETICFKRTREFALETVISSVIPLDKDILVVANHSDDLHIQKLCSLYGVNSTLIHLPESEKELEAALSAYEQQRSYSHILISCDVNTPECKDKIRLLAAELSKTSIKLIVHCRRSPMDLSEISELNVAFMVCNGMSSYISSVVIARRSQLVQTEGISRNDKLDLYNYWQKMLYSRNSGIKPMAV
ncbi:hypothetical protein KDU71_13305 [Carboxylicivirga sediminis]|uniref:Uncharacterized protein n=1 Tax=Carboxylicivirga sediminis TaxID=2006564 RepID=A0A941F6E5_9BACT|nr:hypothetical protein [Carboxylicivirga sediminis]MBR8536545.1 hypothetical protein [Carboxylicivirga sediminis]